MSDSIGVVGAGTMGNGIAQVAARAGCQVIVASVGKVSPKSREILRSLQRDVDKQDSAMVRTRIINNQIHYGRFRTSCSTFISKRTENLAVKRAVFRL